jgi:RNA polymerase sigma-70 factor (ECF subfamily)
LEEKQLLAKLKNPDQIHRAFPILINLHKERLYWHIRRMVYRHEDADDLLQETFVKVYRNISKFKEESSLFSWMYRIATNETLSFLKKEARIKKIDDNEFVEQRVQALEHDELYTGNRISLMLQKAISTLPEKQRLVFNMKYFEDLSYKEISSILDLTEGGLKANYFHAVTKIKTYFKTYDWLDNIEEFEFEKEDNEKG